jgi:serine/threonine protein phosphatase PrpC
MNKLLFQCITEWLRRQTPPKSVKHVEDIGATIGTTIGHVRSDNQDRAIIVRYRTSTPNQSFLLFALCDGMGGMREGGNCAAMTMGTIVASLVVEQQQKPLSLRLKEAVLRADEEVYKRYQGEGGTTLSAVIFSHSKNPIGLNIGDSRIYQYLKKGSVTQISRDDSIAEQVKQIKETNTADLDNEISNSLVQFVGFGEGLQPHIIEAPIFSEQTSLLLSSDGTHTIEKKTFGNIIHFAPSTANVVERLICLSEWYGGKDNASVIFIPPNANTDLSISQTCSKMLEIWDSFATLCYAGPTEAYDEPKNSAPSEKTVEHTSLKETVVHQPKKGTKKSYKKTPKKIESSVVIEIGGNDDSNS